MKFLSKQSKPANRFPFFDDDMDSMFEGFFRPVNKLLDNGKRVPNVDIKDVKDRYVLTADFPGFDKDEITVDMANGSLQIKAEHNEEKEEERDGDVILRERHFGSFFRSFNFGDAVESNDISAKFKDGVLRLELPKSQKSIAKSKRIEIR